MDRVELWPLSGLRVCTPRLSLRHVDADLAFALADLATEGVHDPATMPFLVPWTDAEPPELQRNSIRYHFRSLSEIQPGSWRLSLAVFEGEQLVGVQGIEAMQFPVLRQFSTGSWVGRRFQGRGIGREMRHAVLHLGFAGFGAARAETMAFADNAASLAVTRSLGYQPNGHEWRLRRGEPAEIVRFMLDRATWETRRRDDITIEGLDDNLRDFLGLP